MADADFSKLVPGFDFLQGLVENAGSALPRIGQWVAPTLSPEELEKRIDELRTVKFWLEQNATMLEATIQALEVQRMTLTTLRTMNVQMSDLRESLKIKLPEVEPTAAAKKPAAKPEPKEQSQAEGDAGGEKAAAAGAVPPGVVDPMQWWGALTQQFTKLAADAVKEGTADAARQFSAAMAAVDPGAAAKTATQPEKKAASAKASARGDAAPTAKPAKKAPAKRGKSTARAGGASAARKRTSRGAT